MDGPLVPPGQGLTKFPGFKEDEVHGIVVHHGS
jgi:hypothetical protein